MRRFLTHLIGGIALLLFACGVGCQSNPEGESTFAVPSLGGVPDQWEPEIADPIDLEDEEPELGL